MLAADPDVFDCQTCRVAEALDSLWPENARAWGLYQQLSTRFLVQAGLIGERWKALTDDLDADDRNDLLDRLSVLYDLVNPEPTHTD